MSVLFAAGLFIVAVEDLARARCTSQTCSELQGCNRGRKDAVPLEINVWLIIIVTTIFIHVYTDRYHITEYTIYAILFSTIHKIAGERSTGRMLLASTSQR